MKPAVYFEVDGLAEDEQGNPCPAGMMLAIGGEVDDYDRWIARHDADGWLEVFAGYAGMEYLRDFKGRSRLLSPEEYEEEYGDDD